MLTKDFLLIKSDVSAIKREDGHRLEWFFTDVSMLGIAIILIGGYGQELDGKIHTQKKIRNAANEWR